MNKIKTAGAGARRTLQEYRGAGFRPRLQLCAERIVAREHGAELGHRHRLGAVLAQEAGERVDPEDESAGFASEAACPVGAKGGYYDFPNSQRDKDSTSRRQTAATSRPAAAYAI